MAYHTEQQTKQNGEATTPTRAVGSVNPGRLFGELLFKISNVISFNPDLPLSEIFLSQNEQTKKHSNA